MPSRQTVVKARKLRRELSLPEVLLWTQLRQRPGDLKFRRQHPIGPYVIDFYCASTKLAIEVDGMSHDVGNWSDRDNARDTSLSAQGIRVLRLAATDVLRNMDAVVRVIVATCVAPSTGFAVPPRRSGEEFA